MQNGRNSTKKALVERNLLANINDLTVECLPVALQIARHTDNETFGSLVLKAKKYSLKLQV